MVCVCYLLDNTIQFCIHSSLVHWSNIRSYIMIYILLLLYIFIYSGNIQVTTILVYLWVICSLSKVFVSVCLSLDACSHRWEATMRRIIVTTVSRLLILHESKAQTSGNRFERENCLGFYLYRRPAKRETYAWTSHTPYAIHAMFPLTLSYGNSCVPLKEGAQKDGKETRRERRGMEWKREEGGDEQSGLVGIDGEEALHGGDVNWRTGFGMSPGNVCVCVFLSSVALWGRWLVRC